MKKQKMNTVFKENPPMREKPKYSVFKAILNPFNQISDNLIFFVMLALIFTLILSGLTYFYKAVFAAQTTPETTGELWNEGIRLGLYILIKLLILAVFLRCWTDASAQDKDLLMNVKKTLADIFKIYAVILVFLVINALPAFSSFALFIRTPNPNWLLELAYFTFISLGFVAPFVLMRFYGGFGAILEGQPTSLGNFWILTRGYAYKIILSAAFFYTLILVLFIGFGGIKTAQTVADTLFSNFAVLLIGALTAGFMRTQHAVFSAQKSV